MNKLKTIIDLVNQGDKAKLWKYLNKGIYSKKDKIDVVKSKGGQGGGGDAPSGGNIEYWKHESNIDFLSELGLFCIQMKYDYNGTLYIASMIDYHRSKMGNIYAISIDRSMKIMMGGETVTINDFLSSSGISDFSAFGLVQITEEEFYTIDS